MPLGADDVQAAGGDHGVVAFLPGAPGGVDVGRGRVFAEGGDFRLHVAAEHDVGAAAGHVGGDGDDARPPGLGDDLRLAFVLLGVQHAVLDLAPPQLAGEALRGLDGRGAHQHRLASARGFLDFVHHGVVLFVFGHVDEVVAVVADHWLVGGHDDHVEAVDLLELHRFRVRRAGHAGELAVEAEVVLQRRGGQRLRLVADRHALLRLHGLVQSVGPAAPRHGAPGVFVDDHDLAVLNHVVDVALEQEMGAQRRVDVVQQAEIDGGIEAVVLIEHAEALELVLHQFVAALGEFDLAVLFVHEEVAGFLRLRLVAGQHRRQAALDLVLAHELGRQLVDLHVEIGALVRRAGNDERRARFVDEDRIHFVDDREIQ